jgi:uncharacterized protein YndB with AHSA1/START domain
MTINNDELKNRSLTIEKTLDAPIQLVWEAWTQAEHIANWWGPPGMPLEVLAHDFSVGGQWKYQMMMPDGNPFISEGQYLQIEPHEKIVTTADFKPMTENVEMHMLFKADGEKTHFTFTVVHETEEYGKQQEQMGFYNGWGSALERLNKLLANQ